MLTEILISLLVLLGALFMLVAALGVLRMPDLTMRLHATTKAGVLGVGLIMLGLVIYFMNLGVSARALAIVGFTMLTSPIAAHVMGRAGYVTGVPMWQHSIKDELKGRYHPHTHELASHAPPADAQAPRDGH